MALNNSSSKEILLSHSESALSLQTTPEFVMGPPVESILKNEEKRFLLSVERGDVAGVRRILRECKDRQQEFNINCTDPLGRTALVIAIENESYELLQVLLESGIRVGDALLHAISEDYVEAVEVLLEWEEKYHEDGKPYSWEVIDNENATFTPDITPLILAAHKNSYEILKLLLDRGASLPMPHDVRCGCDDCVTASKLDSLRHSRSRINAYRALASPSLIALSSKDPILTAFELSAELTRLATIESEFKAEYTQLKKQCETFATALLDHARNSYELEVVLNYTAQDDDEIWEPGDRQSLDRLKMAIKYTQKDFVAHANVQQLLGAIWFEGLPGFRRRSLLGQLMEIIRIAIQFPFYSLIYIVAPHSKKGQFMKKAFIKFIFHSASYIFFLFLLGLASQRVEYLIIDWFGTDWMKEIMENWIKHERGCIPGPVEMAIIFYVLGYIWAEIKALWSDGLLEYLSDLWNIVDFIGNSFFMAWICLRIAAWYIVQREQYDGQNPWSPREEWNPYDPMLLSEGMFGAAMIFSFLKIVHIFSVSPHLGPLQISLGRMIIDIIKFFFIYMLVLFAFGCGMNQLLWYYAALEKDKCYSLPGGLPDLEKEAESCFFWRRFANLFETSQSLFWASFGLVDLQSFELTGIKSFTRFWGLLMFGSYSVINVIVLLNMLIAMMSNSYQVISERSDTEWKFARTKLWISYFDDGATVPPPFNLIPTPKSLCRLFQCQSKDMESLKEDSRQKADIRHMEVVRLLVRRYVTAEQKKSEEMGVTEDDVNEIKQDISTFRFELIDILRNNGMDTSMAHLPQEHQATGKKGRVRERRLMKGFQIGMVEDIINEVLTTEKGPTDVFGKIARALARKSTKLKKTEWNAMAARKASIKRNPIGSSENCARRWSQQSLRRSVIESEHAALLSLDPNRLVEYNPRLKEYSPATRVAYAKFKSKTLTVVKETKEEILEKERKETHQVSNTDTEGLDTAKNKQANEKYITSETKTLDQKVILESNSKSESGIAVKDSKTESSTSAPTTRVVSIESQEIKHQNPGDISLAEVKPRQYPKPQPRTTGPKEGWF